MQAFPPLIGDEKGRYRIRILGNSGSGKTTVGHELASILNLPFLSLDQVFWRPGWVIAPEDEFRNKFQMFMEENEAQGWIIDGDYGRRGGTIIQEFATDVIWLDPPLLLYFPRVFLRTCLGILGLHPPCSPGCPESIRAAFFSKESILWWCLSNHRTVVQRNSALMHTWGLGIGSRAQKMRRLGGWGAELRGWLGSVREMAGHAKEL